MQVAGNYKVTALVPMKGQSERVKGKNLRIFGDRPLCKHILDTLEHCRGIDAIIVNTDSKEIEEICQAYSKVLVHERPGFLRGHDVPMNDIIRWDLEHDETNATHFLQTHATNPLLSVQTIIMALDQYFSTLSNYDSMFSVTPIQSRFYTKAIVPLNHDPEKLIKTQDLEPLYEENSCIYIFSRDSFQKSNYKRIGNKPQFFAIGKVEATDIDTEDEFLIAESLWAKLNSIHFGC